MKAAFLFSGQGAQYPQMMKDMYDAYDVVRDVYQCAERVLGRSIADICFNGTQEDLNRTQNTQPCMLACDLTAGYALRSHGVEPAAVGGFSLGEYAALTFADVLSMEDAFHLVQIRADAMQKAVPPSQGAMVALLGVDADRVQALCDEVTEGYVVIANYNSPVQTVISGDSAGIAKALDLAGQSNIHAIPLAVSAPFHCKMMEPAAEALDEAFRKVRFYDPRIPVYMNVNAQPLYKAQNAPQLLVAQVKSAVKWAQTLQHMHEAGINTFVECGPGKVLTGLVKKTLKGNAAYPTDNLADTRQTLSNLV